MTFGDRDVIEPDVAAERFAAIRAAIDPDRRALQHDVLVSGVIEILYQRPELTLTAITEASRALWCSPSISEPLIERALDIARNANLAVPLRDLDGREKWSLTENARLIATADHKAGDLVVSDFTREVGERLDAFEDDRVDSSKQDKIARIFMNAVAAAMADAYEVTGAELDLERLRPLDLDARKVVQAVRDNTEPKLLRNAAVELALAALDPDEPFGNEIVRLLTVGNILHGFAARRDLPAKPDLSGYRIALDTSALVGLIAHPEEVERQVAEDLIRRTAKAGIEVIVTEHVLEEWDRLWDGAYGETSVIDDFELGANTRLIRNPFARQYLLALEDEPRLSWEDFAKRHRQIRDRLIENGVNVRPNGNHAPDCEALSREIAGEIFKQSQDHPRPRSKANARADGDSLAMVHRWRTQRGDLTAFFISRGTFPGKVYAELTGQDAIPIEINSEQWLIYLATICTDDPAEQSRMAEMIADSAIRASFFSMASAYTVEDVIELSKRLTDNGGTPTMEDSRTALQLDLLDVLGEADPADQTMEQKISAVIQKRQTRTTTRLARQQSSLDTRIQETNRAAEQRVATQADRADRAEQRARTAESDAATRERGETYWRRLAVGGFIGLILAAAVIVTVVTGALPAIGLVLLTAAGVLYAIWLDDFASNPAADLRKFLVTVGGEFAALIILEVGLGRWFG